ncbi:MAG: PhzF family phenazine biosynthesis protein [Euryarchaeota archaeon]|nr:PhzF family phenazine biosynthesis protein [Euryarchaeota archaeon]MDE1879658.1 PhzF family phenazine biosynthesis protein [Euryarchaeota archaeon]MDE2045184.1 PhzF family phenazine biosynthesis protein [Thermoplasmata archaeon]
MGLNQNVFILNPLPPRQGALSRTFEFTWVDVFSKRPLEGNQLAVFNDARGLSDPEMQALARETALSETTFVIPREPEVEREKGVRARIFTLSQELNFAGHPSLGTATVLAREDRRKEISLELNSGTIPVRFEGWEESRVYAEMTQPEPWVGRLHRPEEVAKALGCVAEDFDPSYPIQTVSTGNAFVIVPFRSLDFLSRLNPDVRRMQHYLQTTDGTLFYLVCRDTVDPQAKLHARMIFPGSEDPATGSAAGPAATWMLIHKLIQPEETVVIEQGIEIRRPSEMSVTVGIDRGRPTKVRVGGHVVVVMTGRLTL